MMTSPSSAHPRARGFTLIELLVGMSVALIVYTAATEVLMRLDQSRRVGSAQTLLRRDAMLALGWLRRDAAAAGSGNAAGPIRGSTSALSALMPPIIEGGASTRGDPGLNSLTTNRFVLLADVPRPDSAFDGFSSVGEDRYPPLTDTDLSLLNELTGRCSSSNANCTSTPNLNPRVGGIDATAECVAGSTAGCPWGYRKYLSGQPLQIILRDGTWGNLSITGFAYGTPNLVRVSGQSMASLGIASPFPAERVTQMDRVFYKIENGNLSRRQCWAAADPAVTGYVDDAAPLGCSANVAAANDTGWMVVARNLVAGSQFSYFKGDGTATSKPSEVTSIGVTLVFRRDVKISTNTKPVTVTFRDRFQMRAR